MRNAVLAGLLSLAALTCREREDLVLKEISRLEASLQKLEAPGALRKELAGFPKTHRRQLAKAKSAATPEQRLYRLRDPFVGVELLTFFAAQKQPTMESLEATWNGKRAEFAKRGDARGPLLERALEQAARNRAQKLFQASLQYAKSTSPFNGLYYLAEAEGNRRFAEFVASLPEGRNEDAADAKLLRATLQSLQDETVKKFGSDPAGPAMIPVSALLKESGELLDRNLTAGATLALAEARSLLDKPAHADVTSMLREVGASAPAVAAAKPASVQVTLVRWPYT